ncbi:MAG TPA: hypothetical protein VI547_03645 [Anaerolineales bacterium]|nr:hypothetical protein [Anaerolineales bacterium]
MTERDYSHRALIDKLGVKPLSKVSVLGIGDKEFWGQLQERTPDVSRRLRKDSDVVFYAADSEAALKKLDSLKAYIRRDGAIWVVSLKGNQAKIRDVQVIAAAKAAGLVDNKVASFSETRTALRLVIPRALR